MSNVRPNLMAMEKTPTPEGIETWTEGELVFIRWKPRNLPILPPVLLLAFAMGIAGYFCYLLFHEPQLPLVAFPVIAFYLGLVIWLVSTVGAHWMNKTDLIISGESVRSVSGPLPWPGGPVVGREEIRAIVTRERRLRKGGRLSYRLMYIDAADKERVMMQDIGRRDHAEFAEQTIRETLRLKAPKKSEA